MKTITNNIESLFYEVFRSLTAVTVSERQSIHLNSLTHIPVGVLGAQKLFRFEDYGIDDVTPAVREEQ